LSGFGPILSPSSKPNEGTDIDMTNQAHISALERRHQSLDDQIAEAMVHSSSDDLKIAGLKRQKLHLKDEIERLQVMNGMFKK
jgi:hypothetical protein